MFCTRCKIEKSQENFYKRKDRKKSFSSWCISCHNETKKNLYLRTRDRQLKIRKDWYAKNRDKIKSINKKYYYLNNKNCLKSKKEYYKRNHALILDKNKEYNRKNSSRKSLYLREWKSQNSEYMKEWRKKNRHLLRLYNVKRAQRTAQATPPWADLEKIEEIYKLACKKTEETGISHHVDHIIPLKHQLVCGLHVPENLQILTASENSKKSNKFNRQRI